MSDVDLTFAGQIPAYYEKYMRPLFFEPFAKDLAARLATLDGTQVLEIACGTGIVTRELRQALAANVTLVATDLSDSMLEEARKNVPTKGVVWKQADAQDLPFADATFDAAVCQFGIMFFPDKDLAAQEAFRVLKPGGRFLFNVWNAVDQVPPAMIAFQTLSDLIGEPLDFMKVPFGYHDPATIRQLLYAAGFMDIRLENVDRIGHSPSGMDAAMGLLEGTPLVLQLNELAPGKLPALREAVAKAIAKELGEPVKAKLSALVCEARKPG